MSVDSSSSNDSLPSSNDNNLGLLMGCLLTKPIFIIFTAYSVTFILLLLPLCIFILHHGLQQWRKKRSTSSASTMSHSDCFTYHLVVMELAGVVGCVLMFCGVYRVNKTTVFTGYRFMYFTWVGETFFHLLTCGERYLAVVHPITYLSLRGERGVRLRNISVVCVWLISFVCFGLFLVKEINVSLNSCLIILSLTVVSFCSLSVLRVLIGPGPGEQGGRWARLNQSKKRAFYTIVVILGVLVLKFVGTLLLIQLIKSGQSELCMVLANEHWLNLPCSLVLPLLLVQREFGKIVFCKRNNQQELNFQSKIPSDTRK